MITCAGSRCVDFGAVSRFRSRGSFLCSYGPMDGLSIDLTSPIKKK